jgi:hypothetical protein
MCLMLRQSLSLRQSLEERLEQSLRMTPALRLELKQYKEREDVAGRLYQDALEHGRVRRYEKHGLKFEYASVFRKDVPAEIIKRCGYAFSHCRMDSMEFALGGRKFALARGTWHLFVIQDMFDGADPSFIEYGAVHERGEQATLGNHMLASKLEFAVAKVESKLSAFLDWAEDHYPGKLIDVCSYQVHLDLPPSEDLRRELESMRSDEEAANVQKLIEEFEWPYSVLQKLSACKKRSDDAQALIVAGMNKACRFVEAGSWQLKELVPGMRQAVERGFRAVVESGLVKYLDRRRLGDLWPTLLKDLGDVFARTVSMGSAATVERIAALAEAEITGNLPTDGVLSTDFEAAFAAIQQQ